MIACVNYDYGIQLSFLILIPISDNKDFFSCRSNNVSSVQLKNFFIRIIIIIVVVVVVIIHLFVPECVVPCRCMTSLPMS